MLYYNILQHDCICCTIYNTYVDCMNLFSSAQMWFTSVLVFEEDGYALKSPQEKCMLKTAREDLFYDFSALGMVKSNYFKMIFDKQWVLVTSLWCFLVNKLVGIVYDNDNLNILRKSVMPCQCESFYLRTLFPRTCILRQYLLSIGNAL